MQDNVKPIICPYCQSLDYEVLRTLESEFDIWEGVELVEAECNHCYEKYYVENYYQIEDREIRTNRY